MEMRVCGLENITVELKAYLNSFKSDFKQDMAATRDTLNMILQALQPQAPDRTASTAPSSQPPAPAQAQDPAPAQPQHEHLTPLTNPI
ncbi:hypothetical protein F2Q70_00002669 [Brassica cretica]|nr:hypothetical protein F2Q68_00020614 [Brassica cretica]KAF2576182.1 hypothetical protein F2Q70_00002669 [Brassica cretica]